MASSDEDPLLDIETLPLSRSDTASLDALAKGIDDRSSPASEQPRANKRRRDRTKQLGMALNPPPPLPTGPAPTDISPPRHPASASHSGEAFIGDREADFGATSPLIAADRERLDALAQRFRSKFLPRQILCAHCGERQPSDNPACDHCGDSLLLDDRFAITEVLGRGAEGMMFRATRLDRGGEVAIKELSIRRVGSLKTIELFERQSKILRSMDHPAIPSYVDEFVIESGRHVSLYLAQELVIGQTLDAEMKQERHEERDVLEMMIQLLEVLGYLQSLRPPVVHRDIKPRNVMRRQEDRRLVLIDFGAVREVAVGAEEGGSTVAGTFGFMAPEQLLGQAGPATDIYGLAALCVSLLARQDLRDLLDASHRLVWEDRVQASAATRRILKDMLEQDPSKRPSNTERLARRATEALLRLDNPDLPSLQPDVIDRRMKRLRQIKQDIYSEKNPISAKISSIPSKSRDSLKPAEEPRTQLQPMQPKEQSPALWEAADDQTKLVIIAAASFGVGFLFLYMILVMLL